MLKIATIKIDQPEKLFVFRENRPGIYLVNDKEFNNFYMFNLSNIHKALLNGVSLDAAIASIQGTAAFNKSKLKELISAIGLNDFINTPWPEINTYLRGIREKSTPSVTVGPTPETERPKIESLPAEFMGLSPNQVKDVLEFKNKKYLPEQESNVNILLERLISNLKSINNPNISDEKLEQISTAIQDIKDALNEFAAEALNQEDIPEILKSKSKKPQDIPLIKPEDDEEEELERKGKVPHPTTLQADEAISIMKFPSEDYFFIKDAEIQINQEAFRKAYDIAKNYLLYWAKNAIKFQPGGSRYIRPNQDTIRNLNEIAFSIKALDIKIINKYLQFIKELDLATQSTDRENASRLLSYKNSLTKDELTKLVPNLLSSKFYKDMDFAISIAPSLLYACSYTSFLNMQAPRERFINNNNAKNSFPDNIKNSIELSNYFIDKIKTVSEAQVASKFTKFWKVNQASALEIENYRDIVSFLNISNRELLNLAVAKTNNFKLLTYRKTNCPTCNKLIDWSTKSNNKYYSGFDIGVFAPYTINSVNKNVEFSITEDSLRYQDGKTIKYSKPGSDYIKLVQPSEQTLNIIKAMEDKALTWDEINGLVNSSDYDEQTEGLIRRSEALRAVGAIFLCKKNINNLRSLCPISDGTKNNNCGLSYTKPLGDRTYNLQPTWNNSYPSVVSENKVRKSLQYNFDKLDAQWENPELSNIANSRANGGYHFSKTAFGCPCYIDTYNGDENMHYNHSNLAFAITKGVNYQPPTLPNGEDAEIDEETMGYLICGANTSLSCVDRDPASGTYILSYLKNILNTDSKLFVILVEFLARYGFDEVELMQIIEDISRNNFQKVSSKSIGKIESLLLKTAAVILPGTNIYEALKDLTLVCAFGHKFTIEKSLNFGTAHTSLKLKNSTEFKDALDLAFSIGKRNLDLFMKYLTPIDSVFSSLSYAYYDEWINLPSDQRRINSNLLKPNEKDKIILKFQINDQDYCFNDSLLIRQDTIWNNDSSRIVDTLQELRPGDDNVNISAIKTMSSLQAETEQQFDIADEENPESIFLDKENMSSRDAIEGNENKILQDADLNNWEIIMENVMDLAGFSPAIPGGKQRYKGPTDILININCLNRAVVGTLNIIHSWIYNIVEENFGTSLSREILEISKVNNVANDIFKFYIDTKVLNKDSYVEDDSVISLEEGIRKYQDLFLKIFKNNVEFISLIRKGNLTSTEVAYKIIESSISDFINQYDETEIYDECPLDLFISANDIQLLSNQILKDPIFEENKGRVIKSENLENKITLLNPRTEVREKLLGKLTLVSYARYLALALHKMQLLFFNRNSPFYTGYNPFHKTYSFDEILQISTEEIDQIRANYSNIESLIKDERCILVQKEDFEEFGKQYLSMINKAYYFLNAYLANARTLTINPIALNEAKKYVIENFGEKYISKYLAENPKESYEKAEGKLSEQKEMLENIFNIMSSSYRNATYGNQKYNPTNFLPSLGKSKQGLSGHKFFEDLKVRAPIHNSTVSLVNEDYNFNSGKVQAGYFTGPTLREWPLPESGYLTNFKSICHVGVPIPLYQPNQYHGKYADLKDLGIVNAKIVVNVPYYYNEDTVNLKLDVTFLLEKTYSTGKKKVSLSLQKQIGDFKRIYDDEMQKISHQRTQLPELIKEKETEIVSTRYSINKLKENGTPKALRSAGVKIKLLESLEIQRNRMVQDLTNLDNKASQLKNWLDVNISKIQQEYNSLPYSISTIMGNYYLSSAELNNMVENSKLSDYKDTKISGVTLPQLQFTDPINACYLINNQEIHGTPYVDLNGSGIPPEYIKDALMEFVSGLFGLDNIAKAIKSNRRIVKYLTDNNIDLNTLNGRKLLEYQISGSDPLPEFKFKYDENIEPGTWFDLDLDLSSISIQAAQYLLEKEEQAFPYMHKFKNYLSVQKQHGILRASQNEAEEARTISTRAANSMKKYIENLTRGVTDISSDAADNQTKIASFKNSYKSQFIANILLRTIELAAQDQIAVDNILA